MRPGRGPRGGSARCPLTAPSLQLMHPVLESLRGTDRQWLIDTLYAFNSGNVERFQTLKAAWGQQVSAGRASPAPTRPWLRVCVFAQQVLPGHLPPLVPGGRGEVEAAALPTSGRGSGLLGPKGAADSAGAGGVAGPPENVTFHGRRNEAGVEHSVGWVGGVLLRRALGRGGAASQGLGRDDEVILSEVTSEGAPLAAPLVRRVPWGRPARDQSRSLSVCGRCFSGPARVCFCFSTFLKLSRFSELKKDVELTRDDAEWVHVHRDEAGSRPSRAQLECARLHLREAGGRLRRGQAGAWGAGGAPAARGAGPRTQRCTCPAPAETALSGLQSPNPLLGSGLGPAGRGAGVGLAAVPT